MKSEPSGTASATNSLLKIKSLPGLVEMNLRFVEGYLVVKPCIVGGEVEIENSLLDALPFTDLPAFPQESIQICKSPCSTTE